MQFYKVVVRVRPVYDLVFGIYAEDEDRAAEKGIERGAAFATEGALVAWPEPEVYSVEPA